MNSTNNKKSRKNLGKQKRVGKTSRARVDGAPVAVSNDLQQYTRFSSGRDGSSLRMHTCCAITEVNRTSTTAAPAGLLFSGVLQATAVQLSLTRPFARADASGLSVGFTSPVWDLIGSAFTRYRIKKLIFHYEPQCPATATERLVFAFAKDPDHPLLWTSTASSANNLAVADSIAFMPWRSWSMDVSHIMDDTLYYTYDFNASTDSSTDRFSNFGVIACSTSSVSQASSLIGGVLYMETEVEFVEFCPISVTRPALASLGKKLSGFVRGNQDEKDVTVSKKEDDRDVVIKKLLENYHLVGTTPL